MDVEMPEMDGLEATRRMGQGEAGDQAKHISIIAMTAHALSGFKEKCLEAGMNDYLSKPINLPNLKEVLARISAQQGQVDPTPCPKTPAVKPN